MDGSHEWQGLQRWPVFFPVMTKEKFAELSGLAEGVIQGMIEKGHLPSIKIGRYRLVNVAKLAVECGDKAGAVEAPPKH